jgi:hypothetical protein
MSAEQLAADRPEGTLELVHAFYDRCRPASSCPTGVASSSTSEMGR